MQIIIETQQQYQKKYKVSQPYYTSMKNYKNEIVCIYHKNPITKIDKISKKLSCPQCQQQTAQQFKNRIQVMRAKLNTSFTEELTKLKNVKEDIDRVSELFLNHNMVDAKRKIKKQLPAIQSVINQVIDREVQEANKALKLYTEKLLRPWNVLDGKKFQIAYIDFEKAYPDLIQQIQEKKKELKDGIAQKVKVQVNNFYCKLFDL